MQFSRHRRLNGPNGFNGSIRTMSGLSGHNGVTLHFLGAFHRTPGVDYREWRVVGEARPQQTEYTQVCRQCRPPPRTLIEDTVDSDSTSDERD